MQCGEISVTAIMPSDFTHDRWAFRVCGTALSLCFHGRDCSIGIKKPLSHFD